MSAAGPIQHNIGVATSVSTTPPAQENIRQVGVFKGQTVSTNALERSKISLAVKDFGRQDGPRADLGTLSRRTLKQGQATNLQATARIVEQFDKLPNMPDLSALQNLVQTLQSFQDALGYSPDANQQGTQDGTEAEANRALMQDEQKQRSRRIGEQKPETSGDGGASEDEARDGSSDQLRERAPSVDDVLSLLQQTDGDITHQYAALDIARDYFASVDAPSELQELLASAARAFEQPELMRDIRAGYAAAKAARDAAETLETNPAVLREAYRAMLREQKNFGQLFDSLTQFGVTKRFDATVEMFRTAASRDLASAGPSTDPGFLHNLLTELGKLKRVESVLRMAEDLVSKLRRLVPKTEGGLLEPMQVTSNVLNFAAKATVGLSDARTLLGPMTQASAASQVAFANGLRVLHGAIPDDVIASPQARLQQVTTLSSLQNSLVAAEEEAFARERAKS